MSGNDRAKLHAAGFVSMLGLGFLALMVLATVGPEAVGKWNWWGDGGIAGAILGLGTLAAASFAGWQAWRAHLLNERAEIATRYQKAAELLASTTHSTSMSGLFILRDIALEAPDRYYLPIIDLLVAFVEERTEKHGKPLKQLISDIEKASQLPASRIPLMEIPIISQTEQEIRLCLNLIGQLRDTPMGRKIEGARLVPLRMKNICLQETHIENGNFDGMLFDWCRFVNVTFAGCSLIDAGVTGLLSALTFHDCDLTRAAIIDEFPTDRVVRHQVEFLYCDLTDAAVVHSEGDVRVEKSLVSVKTDISAGDVDFDTVFARYKRPRVLTRSREKALELYFSVVSNKFEEPTRRGFRAYKPQKDEKTFSIYTDGINFDETE